VFIFGLPTSSCSRTNAGGSIIEETSRVSKEAQHRARLELAARTGDTDSEEDGPTSQEDNDEDEEYGEELQRPLFQDGGENEQHD
jgi:hypothetical protein